MFCEPLARWRQLSVRERRAKVNWPEEMEFLLRPQCKTIKKVFLVCDNLNTHANKHLLRELRACEDVVGREETGILSHF